MRHVHRHLPRRRADQRHLSLSHAALGDGVTWAPSARIARTAARPRWACATTKSSAPTIATAPASTANSCASRAATPSISTITRSACSRRWCAATASWTRSRGRRRSRPWRRKFNEVAGAGGKFGVIGSNHTTNEENYYLQKFARKVLGTGNIDHRRTGDVPALLDALSGKSGKLATTADLYEKKAVLVIGADLALEQPFLSFQIRANYRHHQARVYVVTSGPVREDKYAAASLRVAAGRRVGCSGIAARPPESRAGAGGCFRRRRQGRRCATVGGFWRIAGHSGAICLPGGLFEFARRGGYGPPSRRRWTGAAGDGGGGGFGCVVGGGREIRSPTATAW